MIGLCLSESAPRIGTLKSINLDMLNPFPAVVRNNNGTFASYKSSNQQKATRYVSNTWDEEKNQVLSSLTGNLKGPFQGRR